MTPEAIPAPLERIPARLDPRNRRCQARLHFSQPTAEGLGAKPLPTPAVLLPRLKRYQTCCW